VAGYGAARRFSKKIYLRNRTLPPVTALVIGIRLAAKFIAGLRFERLANWKNILVAFGATRMTIYQWLRYE
jgi:hypothetical protein